jgi:hypothetical protein
MDADAQPWVRARSVIPISTVTGRGQAPTAFRLTLTRFITVICPSTSTLQHDKSHAYRWAGRGGVVIFGMVSPVAGTRMFFAQL